MDKIYRQWKCITKKTSTLYKPSKRNNPTGLLTIGCNTTIDNLSRFIEVVFASLINNIEIRIRDTSHLLDVIGELNSGMIPSITILIAFDIVNMHASIDNDRSIAAVRNALKTKENKTR